MRDRTVFLTLLQNFSSRPATRTGKDFGVFITHSIANYSTLQSMDFDHVSWTLSDDNAIGVTFFQQGGLLDPVFFRITSVGNNTVCVRGKESAQTHSLNIHGGSQPVTTQFNEILEALQALERKMMKPPVPLDF